MSIKLVSISKSMNRAQIIDSGKTKHIKRMGTRYYSTDDCIYDIKQDTVSKIDTKK